MLKTHVENADDKLSFMSAPALVKVNIKMPSTNTTGSDFAEQFWYDGLYMLHSVKTMFDGGEFTQELTMFSLIITDESNDKQDEKVVEDIKKSGLVGSKVDGSNEQQKAG